MGLVIERSQLQSGDIHELGFVRVCHLVIERKCAIPLKKQW